MRQPTYDEETVVLGFFEAAQKGLAKKVQGGRDLAILDHEDGRIVTLVHPHVWTLPEDLWSDADGGLRIGTLEEDGFALDLQGAVRWAAQTDKQTVRVSEKATRLWLYGRNILGISVERYSHGLGRGDGCIVVNPRGEALGIGQVVGGFKGKGEAVEAVHDLGQYLRDQ